MCKSPPKQGGESENLCLAWAGVTLGIQGLVYAPMRPATVSVYCCRGVYVLHGAVRVWFGASMCELQCSAGDHE